MATTREATRKRGKTGENCSRFWRAAWTTLVYRAGFAKSRDMAASW